MINYNKYRLPNLYVPGAGKSGTSSLHDLLNQHPQICMSSIKEPHFWTQPNFGDFTDADLKKYSELFADSSAKYLGESSTGYLAFPNFLERAKAAYVENPKFIIILRNPIDRIYSHYWWLRGMGSEDLNFKKAVIADFNVEPSELQKLPEGNYKNYFQFGLYSKWISKFYAAFGKENIHIITTENLKQNKLETLNGCFRFLNLDGLNALPEIKSNETKILRFPKIYKHAKKLVWGNYKITKILKPFFPKRLRESIRDNFYQNVHQLTSTNKKYPPISKDQRQWTKELYEEDVAQLKKITNLSFSEWKDFQ